MPERATLTGMILQPPVADSGSLTLPASRLSLPSLSTMAATNTAMAIDSEVAWRAVRARDSAWDGRFIYAMVSTGVCCRPSCPARPTRRDMVRFFPDVASAVSAGFRPCLRCKPDQPAGVDTTLQQAMEYLRTNADRAVPLLELAQVVGLSPAHLQRRFSAGVGCSPKAWHRAWREQLLRDQLKQGEGVAAATYGSGYGSGSRVYEQAATRLGMTPGRYARGGSGVAMSWACAGTSLGRVLVAATDLGVCWVSLGDDDDTLAAELREEFPAATLSPMPSTGEPALKAWLDLVVAAVAGDRSPPRVPLAPRGSVFQIQVWEALRTIPRGERWSYAKLAAALGRPGSARAVARACASNAVAVLIPCHRVIRGDGELAGFRWGLERKAALLAGEL
jgi:AraC family transcriptional regulator of adaptative response/methylated-DNA-[protein]-cysteine methyltransferase